MEDFSPSATPFRKSSFSGASNPNCVEVGMVVSEVRVRDSKHSDGPVLCFTVDEWKAFLAGAKDSQFDVI